ncbi:uncharacterized protein LOC128252811 [Drosophila gunungcola]|uniref:uncharacterized protein LOC128252811 n=1 Tax=Drosophila gunungcola TaxID=103775 RepID=UPI0022E74E5F|nr:uncharacterized protein LOC128252811 [Drosophila gunungcola]XP_052836863.1 uncharacterized protein LOC128252811 [Drosophila gunungcola]
MSGYVSRDLHWLHFLLSMWAVLQVTLCQPYQLPLQRCSNRLENALEHMRRRSVQTKSSSSSSSSSSGRAMWEPPPQSPYQLYHSFYGQHSDPEEDFYNVGGGGGYHTGRSYHAKLLHKNGQAYPFADASNSGGGALELEDLLAVNQEQQQHRQPHKLGAISRVDVEDLKVRVPPAKSASRWVEIDKCKFSTENSTLDTRLIFPDLTLSGKVVMQPMGGKCHMILRLRHAGIEFRTIPLGYDFGSSTYEQSRRLGAASVRTDSHFAEPGFISVFAHGCQGPTGIRLRQSSKRRFGTGTPDVELGEPHMILGSKRAQRWGKYHNQEGYDIRLGQKSPQRDMDPGLELGGDSHAQDSAEFIDVHGDNFYRRQFSKKRRRRRRRFAREDFQDQMNFSEDVLHFEDEQLQQLVEPDARAFADIFGGSSPSGDREELVGEAMSHELEKLFSMGVRGLLTTYMQRALQPAIKETLMENMGYTLSYG